MQIKEFLKNECSGYSIGIFILLFCLSGFEAVKEIPFYLINSHGFSAWFPNAFGSFLYYWFFPHLAGLMIGTIIWTVRTKRDIRYFTYVAIIQLFVFGWLVWSSR